MIKMGLCFCCGEKGHKAGECEKKKEKRLLKGQCICNSNNFRGWHKCTQASCVMDSCAKECVDGCIVASQVLWSVESP
jgi:hypothetical protein